MHACLHERSCICIIIFKRRFVGVRDHLGDFRLESREVHAAENTLEPAHARRLSLSDASVLVFRQSTAG